MKRMSDIFNLPVKHANLPYLLERTEYEEDAAIINAINHVDALCDALQLLFDDYKELADSGDAGNWKLEETDVGMKAIAALKAYRGEK